MSLQLRNMTAQWMLAALLALGTLFLGLGQTIQNPASGGYQLFGQGASEISVSNPLNALENFIQSPEKAPDYANAPKGTVPAGSKYTQVEYDAYVQRKLDAGETPKSPEDYVATRQQFDKGSAAHQAGVEQELDLQRNTYGDDAFIVENRNVNSADGCITCKPDIMVYDPNTNTLHVTEVKTGDATLTSHQAQVYPEIADGTASMNANQLNQLGLPTEYAGQPLSNIPNLNIVIEEVRY